MRHAVAGLAGDREEADLRWGQAGTRPMTSLNPPTLATVSGLLRKIACPRSIEACSSASVLPVRFAQLLYSSNAGGGGKPVGGVGRPARQMHRAAEGAVGIQPARLLVGDLGGEELGLEVDDLVDLRLGRRVQRLGMPERRVDRLRAQALLAPVPHHVGLARHAFSVVLDLEAKVRGQDRAAIHRQDRLAGHRILVEGGARVAAGSVARRPRRCTPHWQAP